MSRAPLRAVPSPASTGPGLREWTETYLVHLRVERALAKNTLDAYASDLAALAAHVGADADVAGIDRDALVGLLAETARRGVSARSQARYLAAWRGFFRFLVAEGAIPKDPTRLVESPKIAKRLPRYLTAAKVDALLGATGDGATGETHAAMLFLLFACGLRVSELVGLDVEDVDLVRALVSVRRGKGGKGRVVPIAPVALNALRLYLDAVRPLRVASRDERALFVSQRTGRRYIRTAVNAILRLLAERAGLGHVHPHMLRHSMATGLLKGGANLVAVQRMLGHADLGSTSVYLHVDVDQLRGVLRKTHPRG